MASLVLYGVFAALVIPALTILFALQGNLLTTNLSMLGNEPRHHVQFILWGILCAVFFSALFLRAFALAGYRGAAGRALLAAACVSFIACVLVPFLPREHPAAAMVHNTLAVAAPLLITLVSLLLSLHLRGVNHRLFVYAIASWALLTALYVGLMIVTGISGLFEVTVVTTLSLNTYFILIWLWRLTARA